MPDTEIAAVQTAALPAVEGFMQRERAGAPQPASGRSADRRKTSCLRLTASNTMARMDL
jgi:hypothetical protein